MEETKICTKCSIEKEIENFYVRRTRNNQRKSICKQCECLSKAPKIKPIKNLEGEIWKDIPGYEGIYQASTEGRIKRIMHRTHATNKLMKYGQNKNGYLHLHLTVNGVGSCLLAHRLIALTFIPNPENKPEVNHKKGIKSDIRVSELEWSTTSENIQHAFDTGLKISSKGSEHGQSKLTEKEVLEIRASLLSPKELSLIYNIKRENIYKILKRERWKHI